MILISVLTYALGKQLGIQGAARELARQLVSIPRVEDDVLPCVRTIQRLRALSDCMLFHGASTTLPKARSRGAHSALKAPGIDHWLMIDDDVETDLETLRRLLAIANTGRVAVLPCAVRSTETDHRVNILWNGQIVQTTGVGGVAFREVRRGGCGLMIVPRAALERVRDEYAPTLSYFDDDGEKRVALFSQMFVGDPDTQMWLGEDYSFCERLRGAGVDIAAPVVGSSIHDGAIIDLADAAALP